MQPVAHAFLPGHRVRLALAGADAANFAQVCTERVLMNTLHARRLFTRRPFTFRPRLLSQPPDAADGWLIHLTADSSLTLPELHAT